jgi:ATP-dependent RNA helicase RhlE
VPSEPEDEGGSSEEVSSEPPCEPSGTEEVPSEPEDEGGSAKEVPSQPSEEGGSSEEVSSEPPCEASGTEEVPSEPEDEGSIDIQKKIWDRSNDARSTGPAETPVVVISCPAGTTVQKDDLNISSSEEVPSEPEEEDGSSQEAVVQEAPSESEVSERASVEPSREKKAKKQPRKRRQKEREESSEPVTVEEPQGSKRTRKRRRRRSRSRNKGETSAVKNTVQKKQSQEKQQSEMMLKDNNQNERNVAVTQELLVKDDPRLFYKSVPIKGLDAPEAFASMNMDPLLGQALAALGFVEPTAIQRRAIPKAMSGKDLIGLAQTGTGKTLAFLLPSLHQLITEQTAFHEPRLLIVTPTRELAHQVAQDAEYIATHINLLITTIYGGASFNQQLKELRSGTDVIVATPGRLLDHIKRKNIQLQMIKILVLDEADRMLDMGFLPEIRSILGKLPEERQTLLFSATMPNGIEALSKEFQRNPELIEVARQVPPEAIEQRFYPVEKHLKIPLLVHLLQQKEQMTSVLVFTETKIEADVVARKLEGAGFSIALMHGDRSQRKRERALENLRSGEARILVATNIAARGLDIYDISHVINYDMPQTVDEYVHRIGRTARGNAMGKAYTFVTFGDEPMAERIEAALEKELPREKAENFNYDVPVPSWAKPSAEQILETLHKPQGLAQRFERMMRRR